MSTQKRIILFFSLLIFSFSFVYAYDDTEVHVIVNINSQQDLERALSVGVMSEMGIAQNGKIDGFILQSKLEKLEKSGLKYEIVKDIFSTEANRKPWYSFDDIRNILIGYAKKYPKIVTLDTISETMEKRPIWELIVSGAPVTAPRQRIYISGSTHGNEKIGTEIIMVFLKELLENYRSDTKIQDIVNRTEFVIHPTLNADGFSQGVRGRRTLSNGKDPNRAFGWKLNGKNSDGSLPYQWPTVKAYYKSMTDSPWFLSFDYHCGMIGLLQPFFTSVNGGRMDEAGYKALSNLYPLTNRENNYQGSKSTWKSPSISRGGGIACDGAYGKCGTMAFLPEVSKHYPPENTIEKICDYNVSCLFKVIEGIQRGVKGVITDKVTGKPIDARVTVEGNGAPIYSDHRSGAFFKYLPTPSGKLTVRVFANGYESISKTVDAVSDGFAEVNFSLQPNGESKYGALALDVVGIDNTLSQEELYNCLEVRDGKSTTIKDGFVIVDFGHKNVIFNSKEKDDLTVISTNDGRYAVYVDNDPNSIVDKGTKLGEGVGTVSFDLEKIALDSVRFVRIETLSGSVALDAIEGEPRPVITSIATNKILHSFSNITLQMSSGLVISGNGNDGLYKVSLINTLGKMVVTHQKNVKSINGKVTLILGKELMSTISSGMYLVSIYSQRDKKTITEKIYKRY